MATRPGYEQPDLRNPFANPQQLQQIPQPQPYQQRRRDYDAESDMSEQYGSRNASSAHLTGGSPYYDNGQYESYSEYCGLVAAVFSSRTDANSCLPSSHCERFSPYFIVLILS